MTELYPTFRPEFQQQGPASNCVIDGKQLGAFGMAMLIDASTLGRKQPSGCAVRRGTNDTVGGLTLPQVANVASRDYGVPIEVRVGSNIATPSTLAARLAAGRKAVIQGNTGVLVGRRQQSTGGPVNHLLEVNDSADWRTVNGLHRPNDVLVYDPAADGRRAGWGVADQGPTWWPWELVLQFAAALNPWGDSRRLGAGRLYAGFGPDVEPYVILRHGGVRTVPFPDRTRAYLPTQPDGRVNVYDRPDQRDGQVVRTMAHGDLFLAWQVTDSGALFRDSRLWYGNRNGTEWVHEYRLAYDNSGGTR
jgi:hypothetical protein